MTHQKTCPHCENIFEARTVRQKYCNSICKERGRKRDHSLIYKRRKNQLYYVDNKDKINKNKRSYKKKRMVEYQDIMRELKQEPCLFCGKTYHFSAMDYHHKDPKEKYKDIAVLVKGMAAMKTIKAEIEKCVLVCSNCHRTHHYFEKLQNKSNNANEQNEHSLEKVA